jgi:hypothetical protein
VRFGAEGAPGPAAGFVGTKSAAPVVRIVESPRQQLAGTGRLDHSDGAVGSGLRQLRIERPSEVQSLTGISIDDAEQRRIGEIQISLTERYLPGVDGIQTREAVALDRLPALRPETLVLPDARINQSRQFRAGCA